MQLQYESPGHPLRITPRERQALQLLADGETPSQVSIRLGISATETEALLSRLFAAMGAATRADAVASAQRRGLLERDQ
jgi:LuxR family transcriptional regulator, quorum-sensing system regulator BjaR1